MRDEDDETNPNPVLLRNGRVAQTSAQCTDHLLCDDCELIVKGPEDYLRTLIEDVDGRTQVWRAAGARERANSYPIEVLRPGEVDLDALSRFALSVIWRGHVTVHVPATDLGPYAESTRRYLLREAPFPDSTRLVAFLHDLSSLPEGTPPITRTFSLPITQRINYCHRHAFIFFGFQFELAVGKRRPPLMDHFCTGTGAEPALIPLLVERSEFLRELGGRIRDAKLTGSLKRFYSLPGAG